MPRLFTGLSVPDDVSRKLALHRGGLPGARWIEEADYHLTLRFLGDVDDALANDFFHELEQIRLPAVEVALEGLEAFGGSRPRAIVARAQASSALVALQAAHERAARRAGAPAESRKFLPHVTLARLKGSTAAQAAGYLASRSIPNSMRFRAEDIVVYSARASTGGGPYVVEARLPLL